eukprot:GEMP01009663.1.p1 GENE.GEMP01009663.1~~GEMP01009663.1.p1  ORF type:complete len:777 (+),score=146.22 GEMP01009663.1:52-2382(+)
MQMVLTAEEKNEIWAKNGSRAPPLHAARGPLGQQYAESREDSQYGDSMWARRSSLDSVVTGAGEGLSIDLSNRNLSSEKIADFLRGPLVAALRGRLRELAGIHRTKAVHVDLSMNKLDSLAIDHLQSFFNVLSDDEFYLRSVKLCHNSIDDEGCMNLTRLILGQSVALQEIDVSHNMITYVGAVTLVAAFSQMRHLYPFAWRDVLVPCVVKLDHNRIAMPQDLMPTLESVGTCKVTYKITSSSTNSKWGVLRTPPGTHKTEIPMIILHLFMVQTARDSVSRSTIIECFTDMQQKLFKEERDSLGLITYSREAMLGRRQPRTKPEPGLKWAVSTRDNIDITMYYSLLQQLNELQRRFTQYASAGKKEHKVRELIASEMKRLPWKRVYVRDGKTTKFVEQVVCLWNGWKEIMEKSYRNDAPMAFREVFQLAIKVSEELMLPSVRKMSDTSDRRSDAMEQFRHRIYECNDASKLWLMLDFARDEKMYDVQQTIEKKLRKLSNEFEQGASWNVGAQEFVPRKKNMGPPQQVGRRTPPYTGEANGSQQLQQQQFYGNGIHNVKYHHQLRSKGRKVLESLGDSRSGHSKTSGDEESSKTYSDYTPNSHHDPALQWFMQRERMNSVNSYGIRPDSLDSGAHTWSAGGDWGVPGNIVNEPDMPSYIPDRGTLGFDEIPRPQDVPNPSNLGFTNKDRFMPKHVPLPRHPSEDAMWKQMAYDEAYGPRLAIFERLSTKVGQNLERFHHSRLPRDSLYAELRHRGDSKSYFTKPPTQTLCMDSLCLP